MTFAINRSSTNFLLSGFSARQILKRGAVLGKRLLVDITDNELRWKILADFWADMMLFMAPSDDTTVHGEYLTNGRFGSLEREESRGEESSGEESRRE